MKKGSWESDILGGIITTLFISFLAWLMVKAWVF